jgi:ubiquinone/menaquinone biosynthesis C-methylase UbiE
MLNGYDILISPLLKGLRRTILTHIEENSSILEVGCGTGEFAKDLIRKKISNYIGVDISEEAITIAKSKVSYPNFRFIASDFLEVEIDEKFDYAIFPMIIHSIPVELALELLTKASKVANRLIIADYLVPQPKNYKALLVKFIERMAGREHFGNFTKFREINGAHFFKTKLGLKDVDQTEYEVFFVIKMNGLS